MKIRDVIGKGVYARPQLKSLSGSNISKTAAKLARGIRKREIEPGTDAWFKAWFRRPYLTGERPFR